VAFSQTRVTRAVAQLVLLWMTIATSVVRAQPNAQPAPVELLAPENPLVPLVRGTGSVVIWLMWRGNGDPTFTITDAIGPANRISASAIQLSKPEFLTKTPGERLITIRISVQGATEARAGTEYVASVLSPGARPLRVRMNEIGTPQFTVSPTSASFTWAVLQAPCETLTITNTGNVPIDTLGASLSAKSVWHTISEAHAATSLLASPIAPGKTDRITVCAPLPATAGTYTGTLALDAGGGKAEAVSVSIAARGPTFGRSELRFLPGALFLTLVLLGFRLSRKLEAWFKNGGLQEAELAIGLNEVLTNLRAARTALIEIVDLPNTSQRLTLLIAETEGGLAAAISAADATAQLDRDTFALHGARWAELVLSAVRGQSARLASVKSKVEATPLPADAPTLARYRTDIEASANPTGVGGAPVTELGGAPLEAARLANPNALRRKVERMARLQRGLVWAITAMGAFVTFYLGNQAFGSLIDYFGVFTWSLGLSQTGAQILSQARSPKS